LREFLAAICPDEDGGFSAVALNYPAVISQGDTIEEAKANIAEAFTAVLEASSKHGEPMEYAEASSAPHECVKAWITLDG
jgi:predicted RNase H-like HicB family nuclease